MTVEWGFCPADGPQKLKPYTGHSPMDELMSLLSTPIGLTGAQTPSVLVTSIWFSQFIVIIYQHDYLDWKTKIRFN
ncbi:hypothetical protein MJO28_004933 [Puccinia striiformis f. sp. tritici]|uniref:Uncharacterized protein n=1 Tax=Puccinia striiformis f. sp. tritici TaxID=168172 RepID=A0ACC0EJA9_9BASI|nr:hypothetical protein MJO28_004933 [Puccinia striiformis f. sp. tritici]